MSAITIWVVCLSRVLVTVSIYTSSFFYSTDICWLSTPLASLGLWLSGSCKGLACVFEQGFLKLQDAFIRALVAPLVENLSLKLLWVQGVSTQGVIQHCSHSWSGVVAGANGHVQHSLSSNTYIDFLFPYIISFYCSFLSSLSPLPSSFISLSFILLSLSHVSPSPSFQPFYSLPSLFPHFPLPGQCSWSPDKKCSRNSLHWTQRWSFCGNLCWMMFLTDLHWRAAANLSFLLAKHLGDIDPTFQPQELYRRPHVLLKY